MMPIVALLTCILIGYIAKVSYVQEEVESSGHKFRSKLLFTVMIKVVCPIFMIVILVTPFVTDI